jgi:hypothetical protein
VKRLTLWATVGGGILLITGLLALGSTIGTPSANATRGFALLLASCGAMIVAVPLYVDARRMQAEHQRAENSKRNLMPCAACGAPAAILWCTTHTQMLCPNCLPRHDDPLRCLYKSLRRGPVPVGRPAGVSGRV